MRPLRLLLRIGGWLLTPFLAWAASFFGAVAGSIAASAIADPYWGVALTAVCGGAAGFAALIVWMRVLRRSPEIREALHVNAEGIPDVVPLDEPPVEVSPKPSVPAASR